MKLRYKYIIFCSLSVLWIQCVNPLCAQESSTYLSGSVSYVTGQSVYVRFANTQGIETGDTLFVLENEMMLPALLVQHRSSMSCLCNPIGARTYKVGDEVVAILRISKVYPEKENVELDVNEQALANITETLPAKSLKSDFFGRVSLSSYSALTEGDADKSHRFRYRLMMQANHISNSKLSAETYLSFAHKAGEWDRVKANLNDALKVYSLALKYDFNESTTLWVGRKINPKIANVGAVDGIQFQKQWNSFYSGAVVGTRPHYKDYGYNADLLEYGTYIGHYSKVTNGFAQSSLAFFEQRNTGNVDRRFMYFQHSNSVVKDVLLFSSMEVDLYKLQDGRAINDFSLTGLYLSLRYRASKKLSFFGSYDNRKNVIYYETFRNYVDDIVEQSSRQGYRFRLDYRPIKYLHLNFNAGTRFKDGDPRANNTFAASSTYSRIPYVNASVTLSGNLMQTSYLDGQIIGGRLAKSLLEGKLYVVLNGRWVRFDYVNIPTQLKQQISELDISYYFNKKLYMSVSVEATFQEDNNYQRIYLNLSKKF